MMQNCESPDRSLMQKNLALRFAEYLKGNMEMQSSPVYIPKSNEEVPMDLF